MGFRNLNLEIIYRSDVHDFPKDFLCPVLGQTLIYKRAVGYFSSTALIEMSAGLYRLSKRKGCKIQLICSPNLSEEDLIAIDKGYDTRENIIIKALDRDITDPVGYYEEERLNLMVNLIATGILDIKLAFMEEDKKTNLYHEKIAVFEDENGDKIATNGSMNESKNGFIDNFESFPVFCSWNGGEQYTTKMDCDFDRLWSNDTKKLKIIDFPQIIIDKLMKYNKGEITVDIDEMEYGYSEILKPPSKFQIPEYIDLRYYQKKAIAAWFNCENQGIFSLCTGAGKTITALAAMCMLGRKLHDNLGVFILCPYIHLVSQWEEDVLDWGFTPIIAHSQSSDKKWEEKVRRSIDRFKRDGRPFICITTNDTFSGDKIQPYVKKIADDDNVLIIVDEAHNFGSQSLSSTMPYNFRYRIGLSATIKRHMDKAGTDRLFRFFGDECITYELEDGIRDGVLVHYDYYPVLVNLESDELQKYGDLTQKLKKYLMFEDGKVKLSKAGEQIAFQRSRLLAGARQKTQTLLEYIQPYKNDDGLLIYCGATLVENEYTGEEEKQIDTVTEMLRIEYGMSVQRFTAQEDLAARQNIKKFFKTGQYQAITAIKCLDEGVNIPGIKTAFILSSSRNPKEFIQRRGRLLRKSDNKEKAVIYDFITLPRSLHDAVPNDYDDDRTIIVGELARMNEFAKLADNGAVAEKVMADIMMTYGVYFDIEEEMKTMEEYYGEG